MCPGGLEPTPIQDPRHQPTDRPFPLFRTIKRNENAFTASLSMMSLRLSRVPSRAWGIHAKFHVLQQARVTGGKAAGGRKPAGISLYLKVRDSSSPPTALAAKTTLRKTACSENKTKQNSEYLLFARNCAYLIRSSQLLDKHIQC